MGGILICADCSLGFKQLIGKEGDVKWRGGYRAEILQAVLAGPAVTSETRAGCRLSGNFYFGVPVQELHFT